MVTIVGNPNGFHLIGVLSSGCKFNSSCYGREILEPFSKWRREQADGAGRKLIIHADNARPRTAAASQEYMEENGITRTRYPPYSLDFASSDFDLLGRAKHCMRGQLFQKPEELWEALRVSKTDME
jgi:transposase